MYLIIISCDKSKNEKMRFLLNSQKSSEKVKKKINYLNNLFEFIMRFIDKKNCNLKR